MKNSIDYEKDSLEQIFDEAKAHFNKVEGRNPLPPLINIKKIISELSNKVCHCLSIYCLNAIIGYLWIFDNSLSSFYILHFYISEQYRNLRLGKLALKELEHNYAEKQMKTVELVVPANNYMGLKFWKSICFDKIISIYEDDQIGTNSMEIELQKQILIANKNIIHLLPVNDINSFFGK